MAFEPKLPPVIPIVEVEPAQIVLWLVVAEEAETERVLIEMVILTHKVVLHKPSALI